MLNMTPETIEVDFQNKVSKEVRLLSEGFERFQVFTPFLFDDGDHLLITLRKKGDDWFLSDEGHTYLHLTYDLEEKDFNTGNRQRIITDALAAFNVRDTGGELQIKVRDGEYGNALYSFIQALLKITDVTYLTRERVRSTFMEDFKQLIQETVPPNRFVFDYYDKEADKKKNYIVDCKINGTVPPLFVFAISGDDKCRDSTICLFQFENRGVQFKSLAVFESQEEIQRKVLARFSDICEKQYSSLDANTDRIRRYLKEFLLESE